MANEIIIFSNAFYESLIFYPIGGFAFPASVIFASTSEILSLALTIAGSTLGSMVNYILGYVIILIIQRNKPKGHYENLYIAGNRLSFLLIISKLPFCELLTVFAGCTKVKPIKALIFLAIGKFAWYSWYLVNLST